MGITGVPAKASHGLNSMGNGEARPREVLQLDAREELRVTSQAQFCFPPSTCNSEQTTTTAASISSATWDDIKGLKQDRWHTEQSLDFGPNSGFLLTQDLGGSR